MTGDGGDLDSHPGDVSRCRSRFDSLGDFGHLPFRVGWQWQVEGRRFGTVAVPAGNLGLVNKKRGGDG